MTSLNGTMTPIETVEVGAGGQAAIEFTNIPQTYTDLKIVLSGRTAGAGSRDDIKITINGDTGSNYSARRVFGIDGGINSQSSSGAPSALNIGSVDADGATASTFANIEFYISNYTGSNNKSISFDWVTENNSSAAWVLGFSAILWSSASAVNSFKVESKAANNFLQHSTATLYGVTSAGYGAKATGGIITQDANYFYHTFLSSGTFTPTSNLTADYLVVAGGGGGGSDGTYVCGGGGAGGLRSTVTATGGGGSLESALSLTSATAYTVTIGGGGAKDNNGSNSSISGSDITTVTSTGGGRGGGAYSSANRTGASGGSGGGSTGYSGTVAGGAGTANQGYAGGSGSSDESSYRSSGGGGGAGVVGQDGGASSRGGNGGNGVTTSISGSSTTYAGGGGGGHPSSPGTGGTGGGGAGATAGTANTGGGGGGSNSGDNGAAGGSGIVIVRYAK